MMMMIILQEIVCTDMESFHPVVRPKIITLIDIQQQGVSVILRVGDRNVIIIYTIHMDENKKI